jgi:hypothetical protein
MSPQYPPLELTFEDGYSRQKTPLKVVLPVAACDRRQRGLDLNGSLEDWDAADLIQDGPMVRMFNRPAVQKQELQYASSRSSIYTGWSEENLYLAFKLGGVPGVAVRPNFVDYQARRAWGEDLAEILIQPIYLEGNTAQGMGPVLHVVCKPSGTAWVERKLDPTMNAIPWAQVEGANVRYVPTLDQERTWRGEITIPWQAIADKRGRPTLLRFNFVQHQHASGESASWAGPIDYGRDDSFMGLLYLREATGTRAIVLPH